MSSKRDLSVFDSLGLPRPAVGVKFLARRPEGIPQLAKTMALCEMIKEAQESSEPFYATKANEDCVGVVPMGWVSKMPVWAESGQLGPKWGVFEESRANSKIYFDVPRFSPGVARYIVFSPIAKLTFNPDLVILLAEPSQAEIVFRAMLYSDGGVIESVTTNVLACSYIFAYPYRTGKVNYVVTGLAFGSKGRKVFPEGKLLIVIPWNWIPKIVDNLNDMEWYLPAYAMSKEEFAATASRFHDEVAVEFAAEPDED